MKFSIRYAIIGLVLSVLVLFYFDVRDVFNGSISQGAFSYALSAYFAKQGAFYLLLSVVLFILVVLSKYFVAPSDPLMPVKKVQTLYLITAMGIPILFIYPLQAVNLVSFVKSSASHYIGLSPTIVFIQNTLYMGVSSSLLIKSYAKRNARPFSLRWLHRFITLVGALTIITLLFPMLLMLFAYSFLPNVRSWQLLFSMNKNTLRHLIPYSPLIIMLMVVALFRSMIKRQQFDETLESDQTSGNFGTSSWAAKKDLEKISAYCGANGIFTGNDMKGRPLYLPLSNKLTISPPGGGKTTASSIPALLSYDGPVFVFDIKGELWAVTARFRSEVLGRSVVVIDPFDVTRQEGFSKGKPEGLLKKFCFNPFDWVPEDKKERDRIINSFAASFVINEGGSVTHFDDNAKILIRGYIDYMMSFNKEQRNLTTLFHLMSESSEEAEITFNQMAQCEGRAGAAANQIKRVGSDERGSILSTSYRQIDWMGDSNLQETLAESNFNLHEFLAGNMDIFVVLPEDQVKEHSRLVRMLLSILMSMIVRSNPHSLPKKKMLFLLEELAQLGYTPDVEKCIEVLRARGVVVWTVFQTLSQIEMFEKPDLFKGAAIKQIFTNDDTKTMEWVQTLGGKKTILTKTLSTNKGDSRQRMQAFGGSVSTGDGESIHETGADLVQLNEIRELPKDEQLIFLHSVKPIRCKKIRYFEYPGFKGKFDPNPLEANHLSI